MASNQGGILGRLSKLTNYLQLMKPTTMLLVVVTGAAALMLEGSISPGLWRQGIWRFGLVLLALFLTGGSANAFNMYFERDIDARMSRTRVRRPLPRGLIKPAHALWFATAIGIGGILIFALFFNLPSALLSLGTIAFYAFFYTLYLKPRTRLNIVIGGAAGAMAPVISWVAAAGQVGT